MPETAPAPDTNTKTELTLTDVGSIGALNVTRIGLATGTFTLLLAGVNEVTASCGPLAAVPVVNVLVAATTSRPARFVSLLTLTV